MSVCVCECVYKHHVFVNISNSITAKGMNFLKILGLNGGQIMRVL